MLYHDYREGGVHPTYFTVGLAQDIPGILDTVHVTAEAVGCVNPGRMPPCPICAPNMCMFAPTNLIVRAEALYGVIEMAAT